MTFDPPLPRGGEIAVLGLGRSGLAATELLRRGGANVYVSDSSQGEEIKAAAEKAHSWGAGAEAGRHDLERIGRSALVVASPGISPQSASIAEALERGIPIVSEIEIALRALGKTPYIAVTGTNGKSTTTALIAHLLRSAGKDAVEAGNIGTPLSMVALRAKRPDWISLEMSSFQLHDTPAIAPAVGVLTNLTPDHLDRYPTADAYYADKALLFRNALSASRWVVNGDDDAVMRMTESVAGQRYRFSVNGEADAFVSGKATGEQLEVLGADIMPAADVPTLGRHNLANTLAALLAVISASEEFQSEWARRKFGASVREFGGLPHRLEQVAAKGGVIWINDSKATNVASTTVALRSMKRPTVLLMGGLHKGEPYTPLIPEIRRVVRKVIAYGESASIIAGDLKSAVDVERRGDDFEDVILSARKIAKSGDVVLLSPACSSYDMFRDFEERGSRFREIVERMV